MNSGKNLYADCIHQTEKHGKNNLTLFFTLIYVLGKTRIVIHRNRKNLKFRYIKANNWKDNLSQEYIPVETTESSRN